MKGYRVRRPKDYEDLMQEIKDDGVFTTLKSILVFAAAIGFKEKNRVNFAETAERIAITLFDENQDMPFIYALALADTNDVSYLREGMFEQTIEIFEEYAAGGLQYLEGVLDKANIKESIESLLAGNGESNLIVEIASEW